MMHLTTAYKSSCALTDEAKNGIQLLAGSLLIVLVQIICYIITQSKCHAILA